jgi:hypothetical protein
LFNLAFALGLLFLFTSRAREKSEMACEAVLLSLSAIRGSRNPARFPGPQSGLEMGMGISGAITLGVFFFC